MNIYHNFLCFLNERLWKILGGRRVWGHIWNVPQSFGLFTYGESSRAERFHFLMSDSSSPLQVEPRELWNASSWRYTRVKLKLKKTDFLFSGVPKTFFLLLSRLAVMKATRWTRPRLLWTPRQDFSYTSASPMGLFHIYCVCDFRKSSRLAKPDGARTRSNSSRFFVWGTRNTFFEVSSSCSRG